MAPIKDIKTMIYAFFELCARRKNVRLHIMGGVDDEEYAQECYTLVKQLKLENVIFTGRVDIVKYMEKLDEMAPLAKADGCTKTNPVIPEIDEFKELFIKVYRGE